MESGVASGTGASFEFAENLLAESKSLKFSNQLIDKDKFMCYDLIN